MLLYQPTRSALLKVKAHHFFPALNYSKGDFFDERRVIGKREWVGYGITSTPSYVDVPEYPMPGVRFREITGDLINLREKEKGDWKKLTMDEKKTLYRTSFRQTFAEMTAPTGEWKSILGSVLFFSGVGVILFALMKIYVLPSQPSSFNEEARAHHLRRMIVNRDGHLTGISSKWDYEKDDWK